MITPTVYHGSTTAFSQFARMSSKRHGDRDEIIDVISPCHFFAEDRKSAQRFAHDRALIDERLRGKKPRNRVHVRPYRLQVNKVLDFVITNKVLDRMFKDGYSYSYNSDAPSPYALQVIEELFGYCPEDWNGVQQLLDDENSVMRLSDEGYDSARLRENDGTITWAVFDASQIKSARKRK